MFEAVADWSKPDLISVLHAPLLLLLLGRSWAGGRQASWLADWLLPGCWLTSWLVSWLAGWLTGSLAAWLPGCLTA